MVKEPVLFVNFKVYKRASSLKAIELAKKCEKVALETEKEIIAVVQAADIYRVNKEAEALKVFCQHVDEVEGGAFTGHILIEDVEENGAAGTILNHSENRIPMDKIEATIKRCKQLGFPVVVCAKDADEVEKIAKLKPNYVAYEPPELIGGEISVSTSKPEVITESVKRAGDVALIVGAGVKTTEDVKTSIKLGAVGVLVASGVVGAENQEQALRDLVKGF
ncbi:triose-phosphate isomerase [Candidatus Woesearchaeota archaeon]|nr:triose-phosphate isomerase [Candidatus Woesearchaeota archaeon]